MLSYWVVYYKRGIWLIMKFDEEGMNVFKQAVDNFMAAGESASFELAGRVLAAARMTVDAAKEDLEDEMDELDEEGLEEVNKLAHEFLSSETGVPDWGSAEG